MMHQLKTWPKYFQAIKGGDKTFEYRKNDRGFEKGDILNLLEYNPDTQQYTGDELHVKVTYILEGQMGIIDGYAIMSIEVI